MKKTAELVFILDRSGSMQHLTEETIGGFNSLVEKQKREGDAFITTVLFDDKYEILHDHIDIHQVPVLTQKEYYARGYTALLDAVGRTINTVERRFADMPESERPAKVIFTITTDGQENRSTEYSLPQIKELITKKRNVCNWEFVFLGANIDAVSTAESMGISRQMSRTYTASSAGCSSTYKVMEKLLTFMKSNDSCDACYASGCSDILSNIE